MDANQMSDVFRWEEFIAITSHVNKDTQQGYPTWMPELMLSFYTAPLMSECDRHVEMLSRRLAESGLFAPEEVHHIVAYKRQIMRNDFVWIHDLEKGWVAEGQDVYSLRSRNRKKFPFAALKELFSLLDGSRL